MKRDYHHYQHQKHYVTGYLKIGQVVPVLN